MADLLPVDVSAEDDDTLTALARAVATEQAKRASLKSLPAQAISCVYQYKQLDGDPQDILAAVQAWITAQEATK